MDVVLAVVLRVRKEQPKAVFLLHQFGLSQARTNYPAENLSALLSEQLTCSFYLSIPAPKIVYIHCKRIDGEAKVTVISHQSKSPEVHVLREPTQVISELAIPLLTSW